MVHCHPLGIYLDKRTLTACVRKQASRKSRSAAEEEGKGGEGTAGLGGGEGGPLTTQGAEGQGWWREGAASGSRAEDGAGVGRGPGRARSIRWDWTGQGGALTGARCGSEGSGGHSGVTEEGP